MRDYNTLDHVKKALEMTHTGKRDLVVMTVHVMKGPDAGYEDISQNQLFTRYEQLLFSRVTAVAEKAGKHVDLLVVPGTNVFDAIAQTAAHLDSADIWAGRSSVMAPADQAKQHRRRLGAAAEEAESAGHVSRRRSERRGRSSSPSARTCRSWPTRTST